MRNELHYGEEFVAEKTDADCAGPFCVIFMTEWLQWMFGAIFDHS